ncbi:MAG: alpha/beta hydrolase [Candidatus Hydrogenedentota bacterium]|nr:MAG: alpha/beta hydrolase [Candidatus Hydrogenedentota bacterium]
MAEVFIFICSMDSFFSLIDNLKGSLKVTLKPVLSLLQSEDRLLAAVNGLAGDSLAQYAPSYAIQMAFYDDGKPISIEQAAKKSNQKIVIFVHGHSDIEKSWFSSKQESIPELLHQELSFSPLFIRYNTGLHISTNGKQLAKLIDKLYQEKKKSNNPVSEIVLIGHSMGGLVIRSAAYYAQGYEWRTYLKALIMIGAPLEGAYMEKISAFAETVLKKLFNPATMVIHELIKRRSAGLRDMKYGYLRDEDWQSEKAYSAPHKHFIPSLDNTKEYVVAASLSKKEKSWIHTFVGDGMVTLKSAKADNTLALPEEHVFVLKGVNHYALMRHKKVADKIKEWLSK